MKKTSTMRQRWRNTAPCTPRRIASGGALAALALLACAATPARAQAEDGTADRLFGEIDPTLSAKIDQLEGLKLAPDNFSEYVTTDNPGSVADPASLRKVFFIYNPGTRKFLSMGGYCGTHAALSDTPHPFWLQTETEQEVTQYLTYPRREGDTREIPTLLEPLMTASTVQVGSKEGVHRSHAAYKSITYTDRDGHVTDLLAGLLTGTETEYKPDGKAFATADLTGTPLDGGTIEAEIDLTGCEPASACIADSKQKPENIISFGTDISKWDKVNENLHLYYWVDTSTDKWNTTGGNLEIEYVNSSWADARRRYLKVKGKQIRVALSHKGLVIGYTDEQDEEQTATYFPYVSIAYEAGKENQTVYFETNADGSLKQDDDGNVIYNPDLTAETGRPYAYTGPIQADGTPELQRFFISTAIEKSDASYEVEGKFLAYAYKSENLADYFVGTFTDRQVNQKNTTGIQDYSSVGQVKKAAQWLPDYSPDTDDNRCYLTLSMPFDDEGKYTDTGDRTFYLRPSGYYVKGPGPNAQNTYYPFDTDHTGQYTDRTQAEQADVFADTQTLGTIAQWKIVTALQYYEAAMEVEQELKNPTDLSFLVQDNSFRRDNGKVREWHAEETLRSSDSEIAAGASKLRIGLDQYYKADPQVNTYYNASGKALTSEDSKEYNQEVNIRSRYNGVCITNGGYGDFYQDVTVYAPGWYTVACKGLTNRGAVLFAQTEDLNRKTAALGSLTDAMYKTINASAAADCYWPFDAGHPMYNSVALLSDPFVKDADKDDNFDTQLWIYVPGASQTSPKRLRIGVHVNSGDGTAMLSEREGVEEQDWTVFTAFRLYYGGQTDETQYLVLDEDWTDYSALESIQPIRDTRTLCLNRRLKYGQWNSIILPAGLTEAQFRSAFGTGAELAELSEMTDREIRFDRVSKAQEAADGNSYWLMPNTPYIILPELEGQEPEYTGQYTPLQGTDVVEISVPEGHYKIPGVQFTAEYFPDVAQSDPTAWSMDYLRATVGDKEYPYLVAATPVSGPDDDGTTPTLTAYGMLAANYTTDDAGTKTPVKGRFQLADSYVMSSNRLTRLGTDGTASKGYRCFFAYKGKDGTPVIPTLYIDGISQVTLGIGDILAADSDAQAAAPVREGVYTFQGQQVRATSDTAGLPAGLYIVGGRKQAVR